ncbi:MAG: B12-binding domain-containing radical SAM protein [Archaeoglobi archaeon]|nr:B12-binding domain-containing radical SAM protein [Candidatus Mnemosynella sp.]
MSSPEIILTADETMMSRYNGGIFVGFSTCMPSGLIPEWFYFRFIAPPVPRRDGRALQCDFGLRILEAVLKREFGESAVEVVHPRDLERVAGEKTEIIGITGHDYLGLNPPTSEFADLCPTGEPLNRKKFLELMSKRVMREKTVIAGGKAAWQLADEEIMRKLNIDYVFIGEAELTAPEVFRRILNGEEVPKIIYGEEAEVGDIPNIRGATIHGLVEIARGCGRGCRFCTPTMQKFRCKSVEHILRDVSVNLQNGQRGICLHSEDLLRYMADGLKVNEEAVRRLIKEVVMLRPEKLGISHIALSTVYHNQELFREISEIIYSNLEQSFIGVQTGIETGSPRLMEMHMKGKCAPSPPDKWPEIVRESIEIMNECNWIPAATIINGLPGETREDVLKTIELVEDLRDSRVLIVPMNFVSMKGSRLDKENSFTKEKMLPEHWELLGICIEHDIRVGRELVNLYLRGLRSYPVKLVFRYLMKGAEKYIERMKRGEPPVDYSKMKSIFPSRKESRA